MNDFRNVAVQLSVEPHAHCGMQDRFFSQVELSTRQAFVQPSEPIVEKQRIQKDNFFPGQHVVEHGFHKDLRCRYDALGSQCPLPQRAMVQSGRFLRFNANGAQ